MKVAKDLVVSLAYQVRTEDGVLVDESPVSAPLDYLHGHGSLISGLETALEGHEVGDKFDVAVAEYERRTEAILHKAQRRETSLRPSIGRTAYNARNSEPASEPLHPHKENFYAA